MSKWLFYTDEDYEEAINNEYFSDEKVANSDYFCLCDGQYNLNSLVLASTAKSTSVALLMSSLSMKNICEEVVMSGELHEALLPFIDFFKEIQSRFEQVFEQYVALTSKFINEIDEIDDAVYTKSTKTNVKRDFSKEKEERLKKKLDDGNSKQAYSFWNTVGNLWNEINCVGIGWIDEHLLGAKKDSDRYMARVLKHNDITKRKLADIFNRAREADHSFSQYFSDLNKDFHKVFWLMWKAREAICSDGLIGGRGRLQELLEQCKEVTISDCNAELSNVASGEDIIIYVEKPENRDFFKEYEDPLADEAYAGVSTGEVIEMVLFEGKAVTKATLFKTFQVPPEVSIEDVYQYLVIKKHLASMIQSLADIDSYSNLGYKNSEEWLEKTNLTENPVYKGISSVAASVLGKMGEKHPLYKELKGCLKVVGDGYEFTEDGMKILLPIFAEYERNREIIKALRNIEGGDSLTDIAIEDLEDEYTRQFQRGMESFFLRTFEEIEKVKAKEVRDAFFEIAGKNAKGLYKAVDLGIKVTGELTGLEEASKSQLEFRAIYQINGRIRESYKANFDIVANGTYTDEDLKNLENSFALYRDTCVKEYQLLAKNAGIHGDYDKMEYYEYLARTLKKKSMKDSREGVLSREEYLAQLSS